MKIIFLVSMSPVFAISLALASGHDGLAEKIAILTFSLLILYVSWALWKEVKN